MRIPPSKAVRSEVSNSVKSQFFDHMKEINFERGKTSTLWSRNKDNCIEYIRLRRTSNFSAWPHFQVNFGFTPKFAADIEDILAPLLRTNQPMYETWSHHVLTETEHHRLNTKGLYSAAEPGTWEFRNLTEVHKKSERIFSYISDHFPTFMSHRMSDEFIASIEFTIIDELPPSFRVLQIISFCNLHNLESAEHCIAYFKNGTFDKKRSHTKKMLEIYADELLSYFKHPQKAHRRYD